MRIKRGTLRTIGAAVVIAGIVTGVGRLIFQTGPQLPLEVVYAEHQVAMRLWTKRSLVKAYDAKGRLICAVPITTTEQNPDVWAVWDNKTVRLRTNSGKGIFCLPVKSNEAITVSSAFDGLLSKKTGIPLCTPGRYEVAFGPQGVHDYVAPTSDKGPYAPTRGVTVVHIMPQVSSGLLGLNGDLALKSGWVVRDAHGNWRVLEPFAEAGLGPR